MELATEKRVRLASLIEKSAQAAAAEGNKIVADAYHATAEFLMGKRSKANATCPSVADLEEAGITPINIES